MFAGTAEVARRVPSSLIDQRTAWAPGATALAISVEMQLIASVLQAGRIRAAPACRCWGQTAPKSRWKGALIVGALGTGAALGPAAGDLVLLADASLVLT